MHHPRLADQFEDFTRPHTSLITASNASLNGPTTTTGTTTTTGPNGTTVTVTYGATTTPSSTIPSYLPIEEVYLPPHYQPINPEDEDDVVPDQHAAFGIARAMDAAERRRVEPVWRDLGMRELEGQWYWGLDDWCGCVVGIGCGGRVGEAIGEFDGWEESYVPALMLYPAPRI
ncbi:uncharacterized protein BHQ10_005703 [Talaromyces amestolkiae]|uniref:Uncharacterized protein n=1 Tax=Talaromyces amestolkiae TaxID=1196081 RepID=A0A364L1T8_TALAM|nr:uncharacterized protein BHQ10_005703 [Talaromyces amestolkiae]RAO69691.1 hypothetical protein BHQ10_005703 [Talaromyces amestolkiae]